MSTARDIHLYLIRHGETEANVDKRLYATKADHAIELTERGIQQATLAGHFIADYLAQQKGQQSEEAFGNIRVWHSPYYRARDTAFHMLRPMGKRFNHENGFLSYREDLFLFEQKAGLYDGQDDESFAQQFPTEAEHYAKQGQFNGRSYASVPLGESRIDIAIRVRHFFGTILSDARRHNIRHVVVVCHGVTLRAITMAWMHYSPEWLDAEKNPDNCWIRHIGGTSQNGYVDEGYIYGDKAPLRDVMATQRHLENADQIIMLRPGRRNAIVPHGVKCLDPFAPS